MEIYPKSTELVIRSVSQDSVGVFHHIRLYLRSVAQSLLSLPVLVSTADSTASLTY
jgi:hypothetical protein